MPNLVFSNLVKVLSLPPNAKNCLNIKNKLLMIKKHQYRLSLSIDLVDFIFRKKIC